MQLHKMKHLSVLADIGLNFTSTQAWPNLRYVIIIRVGI